MRIKIWMLLVFSLAIGCSRTSPEVKTDRAPAELPVVETFATKATNWYIETWPEDWPWWRGPTMDGVAKADLEDHPPSRWSATENIAWKVPLEGEGHASPIVNWDKVFLASADRSAGTQSLSAYQVVGGKPLWTTTIHRGELPSIHEKNTHASATPACDGRQVYTVFLTSDGLWVTAVDLDGKIAWQTKAGPFDVEHGYGSSPVLFHSFVIVAADHQGSGYLVAIDRESGQIVWRTSRTQHASYGTPIVADIGMVHQVLLSGGNLTVSYDAVSGKMLWQSAGPTEVMANTMAAGEQFVYASGGYPDKEILCIRADPKSKARGEVVWRSREGVAYVPSPLLLDDKLLVVNDDGIATCFAADTGKVLWKQRLGGACTASPVFAYGKVYQAAEDGTVHVFYAGDKFKSVAKNKLDGEQYATPAIARGSIYLRTTRHLYCIRMPGIF